MRLRMHHLPSGQDVLETESASPPTPQLDLPCEEPPWAVRKRFFFLVVSSSSMGQSERSAFVDTDDSSPAEQFCRYHEACSEGTSD